MRPATLQLIVEGALPKGDVLAVARIAGILAAKRTPDLIPLCHPLMLTYVSVELTPVPEGAPGGMAGAAAIVIAATVRTTGKTGVEMEALTAVSAAALTIYDMCKAVDRGMRIGDIRLAQKRGGKVGKLFWKSKLKEYTTDCHRLNRFTRIVEVLCFNQICANPLNPSICSLFATPGFLRQQRGDLTTFGLERARTRVPFPAGCGQQLLLGSNSCRQFVHRQHLRQHLFLERGAAAKQAGYFALGQRVARSFALCAQIAQTLLELLKLPRQVAQRAAHPFQPADCGALLGPALI